MKNSFILLLAVKSFVLVAGNDEIKISGTFTCNNYIEDDEEIRVTIMEKDLGTGKSVFLFSHWILHANTVGAALQVVLGRHGKNETIDFDIVSLNVYGI